MTPQLDQRFANMRGYVEEQRGVPVRAREAEVETQLRRLAKLVPVGPGRRFLEMGSGSGWMLILAAKHGLRCAGIEHNPELAELARERAREEEVSIDVTVGSAESHPLEPQSYDIVVANSLLEHIRDYRAALANAYRALRPGG